MDFLGIDVGGTSIKAACVSADGSVRATSAAPTPATASDLTAAVIELSRRLRSADTLAAGVVSPGVLDDGIVRYAANLPWRDEPIRDRVADALGTPVVLGRDVAAAALAESAGRTDPDLLFVSLGTGIAAAHVVGGEVRTGATGRAGEIGHAPVFADGEPCPCGQRGCLEVYASAAGIVRRYARRAGQERSAAEIAQRLGSDPVAATVWHQAVDALAFALVTATLAIDPATITIGGGLAHAGAALLTPLHDAVTARLAWRPAPPITAAVLGGTAGCIGAARLARAALRPEVVPEGVAPGGNRP